MYADLHASYTKKFTAPYGATRIMFTLRPFHSAIGPSFRINPDHASPIRIPVDVTLERSVSTGCVNAVPAMDASDPPSILSPPLRLNSSFPCPVPPPPSR